ncbi:MAG: hypothetical protein NC213_09415 [Acetobacter sp.]|nr:hypothetical protein [Bacteroides sp.]MCM1341948.1 hypothetical protein [Acetobacter sp.]MCM1434132.1 hypothetical protein [Clostridiales bacterium]
MNKNYEIRKSKKILCVILSVIIAFSTFVTMTFGNLLLSDKIDFHNLITAEAATPNVKYYRYNELVGLYKTDYANTENIQYKIGENGEWKKYSVPFSIPAFQTTRIYARLGSSGTAVYQDFSTTSKALGVYTESNTDFDFSYNGVTFEYSRSYNSADENWFDSIDSYVSLSDNFAQVTMPDNTIYNFVKTTDDTFIDELYGYSLKKQSNKYVLLLNNYYYTFSLSSGKYYLSEIKDNFNNKLDLNREVTLVDFTISDQTGRSFSMKEYYQIWNGNSFNRDITDPNGNILNYSMTGDTWNYTTVTDQAGVYLGQYEYTNNKLTKSNDKSIEYYDNGRLEQITYANGSWIKYTYDDAHMTYTTLTSSDETTKTVYNDAFLPVEYTDEYGVVTSYEYDEYYRVKTEKTGDETTSCSYDSNGNIISYITGNADNDAYYTYDSKGNVIREQNGSSYTYYTYDNNKNVLVNASLKDDYEGEAPSNYDASLECFEKTEYTYDDKGRVIGEENSDGAVYRYEYDISGNVSKEIYTYIENDEEKTAVTSYTYDDMGNLLTTVCDKDTASYIYDKAGRTLLCEENGEYTRTVYDEYGRVIQEIGAEDYDASKDSLPTENNYSDANVGARYYYAENGNLEKEINCIDVATYYKYYDKSSTVKTEAFDLYKYEYKQNGDLLNVYIGGKTNADGSYAGGNLYAQYNYNTDNDYLESIEYGNGQTVSYTYNNFGQVLTQSHQYSDSSPEEKQFEYIYADAEREEDSKLLAKYDYNISQKTVYNNEVVEIYNLSFDENGEEILEPYYSYENIESKEAENETKTNAKLVESYGNMVIISEQTENSDVFKKDNEVLFSYNSNIESDSLASTDIVDNNGKTILSTSYSYNEKGYVEEIKTKLRDDNYALSSYKYDDNGRVTEYHYNSKECNWIENYEAYYTYDAKGQLVREDNSNSTMVYEYDKRGNVKSVKTYDFTRGEITEKANETGKIDLEYENTAWIDKINTAFDMPVLYDEAGNPVELADCDFSWTNGRQLEKVTARDTGEVLTSYTYDEDGIRTSKTVNGNTTYFTTIDGRVTSQYTVDENGEKVHEMNFFYSSENEVIGAECDGNMYYYIKSALGDVVGIVNEDNSTYITGYNYTAWGNIYYETISGFSEEEYYVIYNNPMMYRGYYFDMEIGSYYLQSRYYFAPFCRFLNSDLPEYAKVQKDDYAGTNLFAYCCNDPVNNVDPSGCVLNEAELLSYFIEDKLLVRKRIIKRGKTYTDKTGMKVREVKFKNIFTTEFVRISYGKKNQWKKSVDLLKSYSAPTINTYFNVFGESLLTMSESDGVSLGAALVSFAVVAISLTKYAIKNKSLTDYYNLVWGKKGLDPKNKQGYYLINVSKNKQLNGWYVIKVTGRGYKKL